MDLTPFWQLLSARTWMWTFGGDAVTTGAQIAAQGRVSLRQVAQIGPQTVEITAMVSDSRLTAYEAMIALEQNAAQRLVLNTKCLCPAVTNCRHAAAMLHLSREPQFQKQVQERLLAPAPPRETPPSALLAEHAARPTIQHNNAPRPILKLRRIQARLITREHPKGKILRVPVADPMVTYEGCPDPLSITLPFATYEWEQEGVPHQQIRHQEQERHYLRQIRELGLLSLIEAHPGVETISPLNHLAVSPSYELEFWKTFRQEYVPTLQQSGWRVEIAPDFGFDVIELEEHHWSTGLRVEPGQKAGLMYQLEMGIEIEGQRISLIPILADAVQQGLTVQEVADQPETPFLFVIPELGDRMISLPGHRLYPILSILHELGSPSARKKQALRLDRLRAAQFSQLQGLALQMPDELKALGERLSQYTELPVAEPPQGLRATLRPYQQEGLSWLQFLRTYGLHGILADDMGLGKTVQTIAHLLTEVEQGRAEAPSLIIAPTSLLQNWAAEIRKFAPSLRVVVLHGDHRRERYDYIRQCQVAITSYPLLIRDVEKLCSYPWHIMVLDEAHGIKNARTKAAQSVCAIPAQHRLCLTGTPMENHLGELWSLFHFLMPGYLGDQDTFRHGFRLPIEKKQDTLAQQRLSARLKPVMLRRTKDAVAKDLPPKTEIIHTVTLDKAQADLYETIRASVDKQVQQAIAEQGLERSQIIVLDALLKLRQACCHPHLLKADTAKQVMSSAKTDFVMKSLIPELIEEGRRILLFSQFTEMLSLLESEIKAKGYNYLKLTGETKNRQTLVDQFQTGTAPIFLISLKAGGTGLNLTAADTVIHYDPWWNPAAEAQASDRAHRIGQTKPVFVYKIICQGTIEQRILEMQQRKSALVTSLLEGNSEKLRLTQEDVRALLSPLH